MSDELVGPRKKLEASVTKIGKSFDDLVNTVERHAPGLEPDDLKKTFAYLEAVFESARRRAELGFNIGQAANGGFSLDKEMIINEITLPARPQQRLVQGPEEPETPRLVGEKRPSKVAVIEDDGVDFIED